MKINIGDRIRFLNDVGGGIVVGFNGEDEVIVEHDSGFSFPSPRSECVVVSSGNCATTEKNPEVVNSTKGSTDRYNIALGYVATDCDHIMECGVRLYLINDSEYTLFYNISSRGDNRNRNLKGGTLAANGVASIYEFKRGNISDIESLNVQIISTRSFGEYKLQPPINRDIVMRLVKLSKGIGMQRSAVLGCDAVLVDLTRDVTLECATAGERQKLADQFKGGATVKSTLKQQRSNPATPEMVEVDLHIEKLLDSTAGMSNGDILEYQLDYFRQMISQYSRYRGLKLIFIHGKGDGVLRNSIIQELRRMGRGDRYQEASFKRYGYGALMVLM